MQPSIQLLEKKQISSRVAAAAASIHIRRGSKFEVTVISDEAQRFTNPMDVLPTAMFQGAPEESHQKRATRVKVDMEGEDDVEVNVKISEDPERPVAQPDDSIELNPLHVAPLPAVRAQPNPAMKADAEQPARKILMKATVTRKPPAQRQVAIRPAPQQVFVQPAPVKTEARCVVQPVNNNASQHIHVHSTVIVQPAVHSAPQQYYVQPAPAQPAPQQVYVQPALIRQEVQPAPQQVYVQPTPAQAAPQQFFVQPAPVKAEPRCVIPKPVNNNASQQVHVHSTVIVQQQPAVQPAPQQYYVQPAPAQPAPQQYYVQPALAQPAPQQYYVQPASAQPAPQQYYVQPGLAQPAPQKYYVQPATQLYAAPSSFDGPETNQKVESGALLAALDESFEKLKKPTLKKLSRRRREARRRRAASRARRAKRAAAKKAAAKAAPTVLNQRKALQALQRRFDR